MAFGVGFVDKKWISAFGIDRRDWLPNLLNITNDEWLTGITDIMEAVGRYKEAIVPKYSDFVEDAIFILLDTTGATVTGSGTQTVGTTLTAGTSGYVIKTDLILFPNKKVGYVKNVTTASSQDTVTIQSVDGTNLTHTAAQKLSVISMAVGEKSTAPASRKFGQTQYTNKIQTFRTTDSITDIQNMSQVELEFNGSHYVINLDLARKALMFKAGMNAAFMAGQLSATSYEDASPGLTDPLAGGAVQTTRGLNEYVETYGINDTVATPGTFLYSDLGDVVSQLLAARASKNFMVIRPTKVAIVMDNYLKGITTGISAGKLSLDAKEFDISIEKLRYGNHTFQFTANTGILDSPEFFSQTDIVKSMYFIPLDGVKTRDNSTVPRMMIRYMKHGIKNTANVIQDEYVAQFQTGAMANPYPTNDEMALTTHFVSYQGLQVLGAQHFAKSVVLA